MERIFETVFATVTLVVLLCPALYGLAVAFFKAKTRKVDTKHPSFRSGLKMHAFNALLSPCVPLYLAYVDNRLGSGSVGSLLSLPIIPITWFLYSVGRRRIEKAEKTGL
jgi:hypothetical protein